jgi:hypothetical protein
MTNKSNNIPSDIYQKILMYPCKIASTVFAQQFFPGDHVQLTNRESVYVSHVMSEAITKFSVFLENELNPLSDIELAEEHLLPATSDGKFQMRILYFRKLSGFIHCQFFNFYRTINRHFRINAWSIMKISVLKTSKPGSHPTVRRLFPEFTFLPSGPPG